MAYRTSKDTQERKDAKRQLILDTAVTVFAKKGYHNTTVKDIVDEAEISVGSFYFYFKGKEELFAELYDYVVRNFTRTTEKYLDVNYSLAKNFTRSITVNLWMYQCKRELARIMMIEAVGLNPEFEKRRWESIKETSKELEELFRKFKMRNALSVPDERVASFAYGGSFFYLIFDWLEGDEIVKLTDSAYGLVVYNLQALKIQFEDEDVKMYIKEILDELNKN